MSVEENNILYSRSARNVGYALVMAVLGSTLSVANAATSSLKIHVSGHVSASCEIDTVEYGGILDLGTVPVRSKSEAVEGSLLFNINCNTPFDYKLVSRNGQLVHDDNVSILAGSDAFTTAIPYSVELRLELDDAGKSRDVGDTCTSKNMQANNVCARGSSGSLIAINKSGRLNVSIDASNNTSLLSGKYRDTMKLTVFPRH